MSFKIFLKRCLQQYFIITTCITLATGILGLALDPSARLGYDAFFSPLLFGFISLAPAFVLYSRKELSLRETLLRKLLYLFLLEGVLILFGFGAQLLHSFLEASVFALSVFLVFLAVNLIGYFIGRKEAVELNKTLKAYQGRD